MIRYQIYENYKGLGCVITNGDITEYNTTISPELFNQLYEFIENDFEIETDKDKLIISNDEQIWEFCNFMALRKYDKLESVCKKIQEVARAKKQAGKKNVDVAKIAVFGGLIASLVVTSLVGIYFANEVDWAAVFGSEDKAVVEEVSTPPYLEFAVEIPGMNRTIQNNIDKILNGEKESQPVETEVISENTPEPEENIFDKYITEYSACFNLDPVKTIEFARMITKDYVIDFAQVIGNNNYVLENPEAAAMVFCYQLQRDRLATHLSEYGLSKDDFIVPADIVTLNPDKTLNNGLTYTQYLGKICDLLGSDKYYSASISYLETGRVTSYLALNKNNFGGLRGSGEFFTFPTPEAGIIAFCYNLKTYEKLNLQSIYELSGKYVNGNINNPSETWVQNVMAFHNQFVNNSDEFFLPSADLSNEDDYARTRDAN